jgi:hypothetical protein
MFWFASASSNPLLPGNADADPAVKAVVKIIPSAKTSFLMAALPRLMSQLPHRRTSMRPR